MFVSNQAKDVRESRDFLLCESDIRKGKTFTKQK